MKDNSSSSTALSAHQMDVIIVKVGGSSITDKSQLETTNEAALRGFASNISSCIHSRYKSLSSPEDVSETRKVENAPSFVIVHGAGSFGHQSAKKYGLQGKSEPPPAPTTAPTTAWSCTEKETPRRDEAAMERIRRYKMSGLAHTRASVRLLNSKLVNHLLSHSVNAVSIPPCSFPLHAHGGDEHGGATSLLTSVLQSLDAGLVPVLHGDAGLYHSYNTGDGGGCDAGILSGDTLIQVLATHPAWGEGQRRSRRIVTRVVFLTDVPGVCTKDPKRYENAVVVPRIRIDPVSGAMDVCDTDGTADATNSGSNGDGDVEVEGSTHEHDVTGGLVTKLGAAVEVAKKGIEVLVVECGSKDVEVALGGGYPEVGTIVERKVVAGAEG